MKKLLIVLSALFIVNQTMPRYYHRHGSGFGGGFLAGAATTGIFAAAASSGRSVKSDAYYE